MAYISGFVAAVPENNREAYVNMARDAWPFFKKHGAIRMIENWGVDVPHGKETDFYQATKAQDGEAMIFSWVEWPDQATAKQAEENMMNDPEMKMPETMPFDGMRMFWGGFETVFDSNEE